MKIYEVPLTFDSVLRRLLVGSVQCDVKNVDCNES